MTPAARRLVLVACGLIVTGVLAAGAGLVAVPTVMSGGVKPVVPRAVLDAARTGTENLPPRLVAKPVRMTVEGFGSWALLDRVTGALAGSANMNEPNTAESMIKPWIVADYLRTAASKGASVPDSLLRQASAAIRDSDDQAAETLFRLGGRDAVVRRLIAICGLQHTTVASGRWADTRIPASDAVRMGACLADGRAAGPQWTDWLLAEMRQVRGGVADQPPGYCCTGGGRWGIIDGLPPEWTPQVAIKNGWTPIWAEGLWHVNCLAIHPEWVLCVQMRYPIRRGLQYGADVCRSVTEQLLTRH